MDTDLLSTLSGFYVLTRDSELGCYDEQRQFQLDTGLTAALREQNVELIREYRIGAKGKYARIGFIYPTRGEHPWKTATFFFEDHTIRQIYPVGTVNAPLTVFQKKHQRNSYYRAMETLIATRTKETETLVFCPVLFDSGATLDQYVQILGREKRDDDAQTPVIEVLNLIANRSTTHRDVSALQAVEARVRSVLIQREKSHSDTFTLLDQVRFENARAKGWDDVNVREQGQVTLSAQDLDRLHESQRHDGVERWLEIPHRPVNPSDLRRFVHFRELNSACLDVLAARSLVYTAPSGTALLEQGMNDNWNMYLLEGTLLLTTADGKTLTVEGGSAKADSPVAFLKPRKYKVISLTKVSFLWIHDALLRAARTARDARAASSSKQLPIAS